MATKKTTKSRKKKKIFNKKLVIPWCLFAGSLVSFILYHSYSQDIKTPDTNHTTRQETIVTMLNKELPLTPKKRADYEKKYTRLLPNVTILLYGDGGTAKNPKEGSIYHNMMRTYPRKSPEQIPDKVIYDELIDTIRLVENPKKTSEINDQELIYFVYVLEKAEKSIDTRSGLSKFFSGLYKEGKERIEESPEIVIDGIVNK